MTNFENLMKFFIQPDGGINNIAQLLVVKKDDYNYTSNLLFENFTTRQQAVDATIDKLKDTYEDSNCISINFFKKIFKEENPDLD